MFDRCVSVAWVGKVSSLPSTLSMLILGGATPVEDIDVKKTVTPRIKNVKKRVFLKRN